MKRSDTYQQRRLDMVETIRWHTSDAQQYTGLSDLSAAVLEAMATVPRHEFVPDAERSAAYSDRALPIGYGQTISQPFIVALMTHLLLPQSDSRILEIGTGSGYQAAVLSLLVEAVYSIEVVPELAREAGRVLQRLGYDNVQVRSGNGRLGWPEAAPFDGIIVTAGGDIPDALIEQLKPGGRMVIPVGSWHQVQQLTVLEKGDNGALGEKQVLPVNFVPLVN